MSKFVIFLGGFSQEVELINNVRDLLQNTITQSENQIRYLLLIRCFNYDLTVLTMHKLCSVRIIIIIISIIIHLK